MFQERLNIFSREIQIHPLSTNQGIQEELSIFWGTESFKQLKQFLSCSSKIKLFLFVDIFITQPVLLNLFVIQNRNHIDSRNLPKRIIVCHIFYLQFIIKMLLFFCLLEIHNSDDIHNISHLESFFLIASQYYFVYASSTVHLSDPFSLAFGYDCSVYLSIQDYMLVILAINFLGIIVIQPKFVDYYIGLELFPSTYFSWLD